ncbi:MAG: hypothetical protein IPP22_15635 [Nitrosomonas sp.]|nr:hypothetical protein [Nitrosomonas sp.]
MRGQVRNAKGNRDRFVLSCWRTPAKILRPFRQIHPQSRIEPSSTVSADSKPTWPPPCWIVVASRLTLALCHLRLRFKKNYATQFVSFLCHPLPSKQRRPAGSANLINPSHHHPLVIDLTDHTKDNAVDRINALIGRYQSAGGMSNDPAGTHC